MVRINRNVRAASAETSGSPISRHSGAPNHWQASHYDIIILGAGIAGLAAARKATKAGKRILVIDKGKRIGGRFATRRASGFTFTHGAQFLTAHDTKHDDSFGNVCADALAHGVLANWNFDGKSTLIGSPTMRDFPTFLGRDINIMQAVEITHIKTANTGLEFHDADGLVASCDQTIITAPAPQTAKLLWHIAPALALTADAVKFAPCWTAMFGFNDPSQLPQTPQPMRFRDSPIAFASWEARRPSSDASNHALTLQASAEWSQAHLEDDSDEAMAALLDALGVAVGEAFPTPDYAAAHRWRYAKVMTPADPEAPCVASCGRIAIAGDWMIGARVEAAFISGQNAASRLVGAQQ